MATRYSSGRAGDRIPVGARFSSPVRIGSAAHPAFYTMATVSYPGRKAARAWR